MNQLSNSAVVFYARSNEFLAEQVCTRDVVDVLLAGADLMDSQSML